MSRLSASYHLGRHPTACAATGAPLAPGDRYIAALRERDDGDELDWLGYHPDAWNADAPPAGLIAWWSATVPDKAEPARHRIDRDALLDLFDQLEGATEPNRLAFRHVLALILIRKKHLVHVGQGDAGPSGAPAMLVRRREAPDAEPSVVIDPDLTAETLRHATNQVASLLALTDEEGDP